MKSFLLCLIAVASFTSQGFAVPLPDGEVMVGVYYNSSSPSVENKSEEIFENDPVDAIYMAINGAKSSQVTANDTEVKKFVPSIPETNIFNIPFLSQKTPSDPIEANETVIEALNLEFDKKFLNPLEFLGSVEIFNATDLESNQTESNDSEFVDYPKVSGNNTMVLVSFSNLTFDGSDSNGTDFNSSEIDDMIDKVINSTYLPTLFFNLTFDESDSNETDLKGLEMGNISIEKFNITNFPTFFFNFTADDLNSNETDFNSSEIDDMIGKVINATYLPTLFLNLTADESSSNETEFNSTEIDNLANNVINSLDLMVLLANFTEDALKVNETSF